MRKFRILLIEDNPDHASLTADCLQSDGEEVEVECLASGEEALAFLTDRYAKANELPDLLLLDINMPGMNGLDLLRHVKSDSKLRIIPAVMLSTSMSMRDINEAKANHANSYVLKSSDFDSLESALLQLKRYWRETDTAAPA
ncbi:MAG: response regulator [Silicimonas sp.]|nr:response regulator [Silicimonas sp.]MBT8426355.1 response regulator [Silicimonas sp.]NND43150.1 response regulator [Silicimonas sp.]NNL36552.1 response regulator [Silicimonas sp.]